MSDTCPHCNKSVIEKFEWTYGMPSPLKIDGAGCLDTGINRVDGQTLVTGTYYRHSGDVASDNGYGMTGYGQPPENPGNE